MTQEKSWFKKIAAKFKPSEEEELASGTEISGLRKDLLGDLTSYDPSLAARLNTLLDQIENDEIKPPLLPQVALELLALSRSSSVNFEKMAQLAVGDPAVAARIMELSSSPFVSPLSPPKGLKEALVRLGVDGVRQVAFELSFSSKTLKRGPHVRMAERTILHARTASALCRLLAKDVGVHSGLAALTGLVHALGGVVLIDALSQTAAKGRSGKASLRPVPGFLVYLCVNRLHPLVTAQIAAHFSLEQPLINAVKGHHHTLEEAEPLTRLLFFADLISPGEPGARVIPLEEALTRSGLPLEEPAVRHRLAPLIQSVEGQRSQLP